MDGLVCDACGDALLADSDVRYVLEIRGYAAYDPLEITRQDLAGDLEGEMKKLLTELEATNEEDAESQVHRAWKLDLCPRCWRSYQRDPLSGYRSTPESDA
ncbi:MAG TPA: hypothetical protein VFD71_09180 [Planctomycetota bacterium]|jgi:hypothetical protein|nr:hypothetical protein [Planctomycetota bacterium]